MEKETTTAAELADRFEVSTRTIYRDIETLSQAGIPIYTTQGKGGGISLTDRFILNKSLVTEKEQTTILLALQNLSATQFPEADELLSKIGSFFRQNNENWIEIDFSSWGSGQWQKEKFTQLKHAILDQQLISFSYLGSNGEKKQRKVAPLKLFFKERSWYIEGYCLDRMAQRTFKITRMSEIRVKGNSPIKDKPIETTAPASTPEESPTAKVSLKLKILADGAYRLYDDFSEKDITKENDGSFLVNTSVPEGEWVYHYLLSYGTLLEVIEPENVRAGLKKRIRIMNQIYFS